jgi:aspartate/methionine/tyrosine aminotransferase
LVLNTPHNPTGHVLTAETLHNILDEAAAVGTTTVVDEVFSGIWHDTMLPVPSAAVLNPRAVVIGSLSKVYGLSGLRVGWLVGPADFIRDCKRWRHHTSNCPPAVVQELACVALRQRETLLRQSQQIADVNYRHALEWLERHAQFFTWVKPQGGLVMLLRLQIPIPAAEFSKELAEKHRVLLIPCTTCFYMSEGYLRLGLGGDPDRFREGLNRVSAYLTTSLIFRR